MQRIRRSLDACTWSALCAVWLLALGPALTHALATPSGAWGEVCTARGLVRVPVDGGRAPHDGMPAPVSAPTLAHCPLCGLGAAVPVLPSAPPAFALATATHAPPQATLARDRSDPGWPDGWPRAPPARTA